MKTGFRSIHPVTGLIFYMFVMILSITATHPVVLIISLVCPLMYDIKLRGRASFSFFLKRVIPLILISSLINGLFSHYGVTVLFTLPSSNAFTLEAMVYGAVFALRAGSVLMWLGSLNEVMTSDKIIWLFGRISPKTALIISMALRFIPLISSQSEEIALAEKGIGCAVSSSSFISRVRSGAKRLSILVSWSLERGIDTQNSMNARGYGLKGRTSYSPFIFSVKDALYFGFSVIGAVLLFITKDTLTAFYYPVIIIPFPSVFEIITCIVFAVLLLLPLINDISEDKKWSISA